MTALPAKDALPTDIERAKRVGELAQCVLWREIDGKKVPVDSSGRSVNPLDSANQMSFATAAQIYAAARTMVPSLYTGIGVVLTGTPRADGLVLTVVDYDAKGNISAEERARRDRVAEEHATLFNSYTETSVSGVGRHIVIWARPAGRNLKLGVHGEIEVFQAKRFVEVTGRLIGQARGVEARADELDQIVAEVGGKSVSHRQKGGPLRIVGGLDFDVAGFGPVPAAFRDRTLDNDLAAGIERTDVSELPAKQDVEQWCDTIIKSPTALNALGDYDAWVNTLGFPLARLANAEPPDEKVYRELFLRVSATAPNYDEAAAEAKWDDLYGVAREHRDVKSSWPSLRHFARQHGYVDPLPTVPGGAVTNSGVTSKVTGAGGAAVDLLRFTSVPLKEAVARINTEFFVLRSSGKIYRHDSDGELHALPKQDFKTALGGRWVDILDDNGSDKRRSAADAWLDAPERREYRGFQYCPNNAGLKPTT